MELRLRISAIVVEFNTASSYLSAILFRRRSARILCCAFALIVFEG